MGTPYTSGPHILACEGGEVAHLQIRTPHRGTIKSVKMDQIAGTEAACVFEVFTSAAALPPGWRAGSSMSSESLDEATQGPASAYSIFGPKTRNASTPFHENEKDYVFRNKDGTSTNPQQKLYVRLEPDGSGAKEYALTLEMETSPIG